MSFLSQLLLPSLIRCAVVSRKWSLSSYLNYDIIILGYRKGHHYSDYFYMQFLIAGADKRNKGDYFASLIAKVVATSLVQYTPPFLFYLIFFLGECLVIYGVLTCSTRLRPLVEHKYCRILLICPEILECRTSNSHIKIMIIQQPGRSSTLQGQWNKNIYVYSCFLHPYEHY